MAKRDIRIDYDCLAVVERQLKKQRNALEKLRTAMGKADSAASAGNTAKSIDGLKKRYKKAKKRLDDCYEEVDALYDLIHGYIRDMTGIIQPKRGKTRVGRNDIYMNLQSVKHGIDDIRDVQDSHCLFPSSGIGKTEEEKRRMERNYEKIETQAWGSLFPKMRKTVEESRRKLQGYYDHDITNYENKDDEYKRKSEKVRYRYSSPWELFKQNTIDTVSFAWSIIKGAGMAGLDLLKGFYSIGNMIYYGVSADVAAIVCLVSSDPPEWTEEVLGESEEYFGNIVRAISHPVETIEAMAQSANDTYEEEGLTYMVSYVVADIAIGKAAAGKYSKVKAADKADDVADVVSKVDLGDKLDYLFGKATGIKHNIQRSKSMLAELRKIGIHDTPASREYLAKHLNDVLKDPSNISKVEVRSYIAKELPDTPIVEYTATTRESLLIGPGGAVKIESVWNDDKLLTVIVKGGN